MPNGQFNPVASDENIVWRNALDQGKYLIVVTQVPGTTKGDGWLHIWEGANLALIHRVPVHISTGALFGVDAGDEEDWMVESIKAADNPGYRRKVLT